MGIKRGWLFVIAAGIIALAGFFSEAGAFQKQTNNENAVRVDVKPIQLVAGKPAVFEVRLNTHSVNLAYDLEKISLLQDESGKQYRALNWDGSPPGGHHRRGKLEFPKLEGSPQSVKLIIRDVSGVPERIFEWKLGEKS